MSQRYVNIDLDSVDCEENRELFRAVEASEDLHDVQPMPSAGVTNPRLAQLQYNDAASRDGADSGIDVKPESLPPLAKVKDPSDAINAEIIARKEYSPVALTPCYHPDPNYRRWISPRTARQRSVRSRLPSSMLSNYEPVFNASKIITWDEAMESRPPLRIDMVGPTPTTYSPRNKPLYETNSPAYSFGRKETDKDGGGQKSWSKLWTRSHSPFTFKTKYEMRWPTPQHYQHKSTLGPRQAVRRDFPSHSIAVRRGSTMKTELRYQMQDAYCRMVPDWKPTLSHYGVRRGQRMIVKEREERPASNQYQPELATRQVLKSAPAFSMAYKCPKELWVHPVKVPGPDVYRLRTAFVKPHRPAFTLCGERRGKRHDIGPFTTL